MCPDTDITDFGAAIPPNQDKPATSGKFTDGGSRASQLVETEMGTCKGAKFMLAKLMLNLILSKPCLEILWKCVLKK